MAENHIKYEDADYVLGSAAAGVALTANFADNTSLWITSAYDTAIAVHVFYTPGSDGTGSTCELKVEETCDDPTPSTASPVAAQQTIRSLAPDDTYATETPATHKSAAGVASTLLAYKFTDQVNSKGFRISAKENKAGTAFGTIKIRVLVAG